MPSSWTASGAQKNVPVNFAPGWPASVMWSQPNQPNGATSTVAVGNGVVMNVTTAKPTSTTDDEGNPIIIGALVASAQLTPVTSSTSRFSDHRRRGGVVQASGRFCARTTQARYRHTRR